MRCLVVEDEPLARSKLLTLLRSERWIDHVFEASTHQQAFATLRESRPEIVFLDIHLPDGSGLSLLSELEYQPTVVFTTAFDEYAVTAFELQALDYLVKPFSADRFQATLRRVRVAIGVTQPDWQARVASAASPETPERIFVRVGRDMVSLELATVERVEGCDDHASLWVGPRSYLLYRRLSELQAPLELAGFVRVHRSHLVNRAKVVRLTPTTDGRLTITMESGARIVTSRSRTAAVRRALRGAST